MGRYLVGIDLGTTNSALAYVDLQKGPRGGQVEIQPFPIRQVVGVGDVKDRQLLPSFLYLPAGPDLAPDAIALPWDASRTYVVGEFARSQGSRVPGRLVTSAKSWLCHAGVDRAAALLPWTAPPDVPRISPVEASARYLRHMIEAWNYKMAADRPEDRLENQDVVLTVPASFDDVARTLTVEAAGKAGLKNITLLEEPQAAFYCWLCTHPPQEASQLKPGSRCVVVDVGGGTTDFSLIEAVEQQGELGFVRQAVGEHLLLGGDNMDLALAKFLESKLPGAGKLDAAQYGVLTQACRQAKEALLAPTPPASVPVTVMGRGRSVIGGMLHTQLTPDEVRHVIFDGFFPVVPAGSEPERGPRTGLHEMGLPYVADPAITRHLSAFLTQQARGPDAAPAAILFNGGVFQPESLRQRLLEVLHSWYDRPGKPWQPLVLTNPSLDLAVAWGAAYYGWLRHSGGKRIGGGIARSYYIAIEAGSELGTGSAELPERDKSASDSSALPVPSSELTVVCVVPQHLEEGQEIELPKPELALALGQPVLFPLYTSTVRSEDKPGDLLRVRPEQLLQLPPLHTVLRGGKRSGTKSVPVTLAAKVTAIGTLELYCVAKEGGNRWRLEFNIRDLVQPSSGRERGEPGASAPGAAAEGERTITDVWVESQVQEAGRLIRAVYKGPGPGETAPAPPELTKALENALEAPRQEWPTGLCRRLWDFLLEVAEERRQSLPHLTRWHNLVGWCLRPGFGDPLDKYRVEQLWKTIFTPPRRDGGKVLHLADAGADYWIMWRRVAAGLSAQLQQSLFDRLRGTLLPIKGKVFVKPNPNELAEMWRAAGSLERLDPRNKVDLGTTLLKSVKRSPVPSYTFWTLTRLGARVLVYGPLNTIVHHQIVEGWLDALLPFQPGHESERTSWAFCLSQLARRTGQRALDVDDSHRQSVLTVLRTLPVPQRWVDAVEHVIERESEEQGQMLGDTLPIGLRLVQTQE
jgi:molecular chaperone DnaK (HSP70)